MNLSLYLVLVAIAVLGVFSVFVIFGDQLRYYLKRSRGQKQHRIEPQSLLREEHIIHERAYSGSENVFNPLVEDTLDQLLMEEEVTPESNRKSDSDLIVIYLMALSDQPFMGYELFQALSANGLHYGEMQIFHYYKQNENNTKEVELGKRSIQFSIASAVEPGSFDMMNVGGTFCPGLSIFMNLNVEKPLEVFECMCSITQQLADDLEGFVLDDKKQALTPEILEHYRQRIRNSYVKGL